MSRINDLLNQLQGLIVFYKTDLRFGYHQFRIRKEDIPKIAFRSCYGYYKLLVMSFRLTYSPTIYADFMNYIFKPYSDFFMIIFVDDILVYSRSGKKHAMHLRTVLHTLRDHRIHAKFSKCMFQIDYLDLLEHMVSNDDTMVDPIKIAAICNWASPMCHTEVHNFIRLENYYKWFVERFFSIVDSMTRLTKKEVPFQWSKGCEVSRLVY